MNTSTGTAFTILIALLAGGLSVFGSSQPRLAGFKPHGATLGAKPRKNGRKRTYRFTLPSLRSFRFELLHLPGKIARPAGRTQLRIAAAPDSQRRIRAIERKLAA